MADETTVPVALPVSVNERIDVLDVLRGLAIGGILIGNLQWLSGYGILPPAQVEQNPLTDHITRYLVHFFVEGKFYSIFSFLFGFGFAIQMARSEERGDTTASLFKRRLFWLLMIGIFHAVFVWAGDILSVYALLGFALILFRKKSDKSLLKWAFGLMLVPIVVYLALFILFVSFAPPNIDELVAAGQADMWTSAIQTVPNGGYWQIFSDYNLQLLAGRWAGLIVQMRLPKILAMFLLGVYAYRRGFLQNAGEHQPFIRRVLIWGLGLGIAGNAAFAYFAKSEADFPPSASGLVGIIFYAFAVPAMALGIAALITRIWQTDIWRTPLSILAPVGRMALTNYLLQSIVCVTIFYGYGFGQFGRFGAAASTLIGLAIFAAQIAVSTLWMRRFRYGPMEWLWRRLTYRHKLAFLR